MRQPSSIRLAGLALSTFLLLPSACNQSTFGGSAGTNAAQSPSKESAPPEDGRPGKSPKSTSTGESQNADAVDTGRPEESRCLSKPVDVRVVFLLDATRSMQESIDLVKSNVQAFTSAVQNIKFSSDVITVAGVDIGMITYRDDISELRQIAFGPADQLGSSLGYIVADEGSDNYEGGLTALLAGLEMIEQKPQAPDHDLVSVVVAITDNFSHNGEGGFPPGAPPQDMSSYVQRNCRVEWAPLEKKIGRKAFDRLLVYDASPSDYFIDPTLGPCGGYEALGDSPSKQWQDLRALWSVAGRGRPAAALGRGFGFPFTSEALLTTLPQDLAASFQACKATPAPAEAGSP